LTDEVVYSPDLIVYAQMPEGNSHMQIGTEVKLKVRQ